MNKKKFDEIIIPLIVVGIIVLAIMFIDATITLSVIGIAGFILWSILRGIVNISKELSNDWRLWDRFNMMKDYFKTGDHD